MLSEFKNASLRGMDLETLVAVATFGRQYKAEFEELGVEAPEWVDNQLTSVRREIKSRNADRIAAKLRDAKARLETLKTPSEKRAALQDEIKNLEKLVKSA